MSLHQAAKHLQNHGRNGDSMLVHMTRGEVNSLNKLAMAHGGQLSTNPHTGLPEASFLSSLLPTLIGAGLMVGSGGAINPLTAGLIVGGGATIASGGDLKKGLMAGIGAYGGAGLGSSMAAAGAATPAAGAVAGAVPPVPLATPPNVITPGVDVAVPAPAVAAVPAPAVAAVPPAASPDVLKNMSVSDRFAALGNGATSGAGWQAAGDYAVANPKTAFAAAVPVIADSMQPKPVEEKKVDKDMGQRFVYDPGRTTPTPEPDAGGSAPEYFKPKYNKVSDEEAKRIYGFADGGMPVGGVPMPTGGISDAMGGNRPLPISSMNAFSAPFTNSSQSPMGAPPQYAQGGISHLGDYSDGGRLLRGPGDGISDSIPAMIGQKQPARLADGEFVVPARIVSELGNGSTEAGARKLYAMMDRVQKARGKTVGKGRVAKNSRADKYLPA